MNQLPPKALQTIREGAELSNYKPYIDADLDKMKQSVVNSVLMLANSNELTPEIAQAKWFEYIALVRLGQNIGKRITVGVDLGNKMMPKEI